MQGEGVVVQNWDTLSHTHTLAVFHVQSPSLYLSLVPAQEGGRRGGTQSEVCRLVVQVLRIDNGGRWTCCRVQRKIHRSHWGQLDEIPRFLFCRTLCTTCVDVTHASARKKEKCRTSPNWNMVKSECFEKVEKVLVSTNIWFFSLNMTKQIFCIICAQNWNCMTSTLLSAVC